MDVAVVGAGAVGTTAASDLAAAGATVTLYDREGVAAGSSGRAAGICYDAFAGRVDAAVAQRAMDRFRRLSADPDVPFVLTDRPYVWLAREGDERRAAAVREHVPRMRERGRDVSFVDGSSLADRFPALRTADLAVAAVAETAGYADPAGYARAMADRAVAAGARLRTGDPVALAADDPTTVRVAGERRAFDAVLVAAGAHSRQVLASAGLPIPVKPYRVQALTTAPTPVAGEVPMLYDATGGYYLRPDGDGLLVGNGTEPVERDPDDWDPAADDWFLEDCAGYVETAVGRSPPVERAWAGLCTATPDGDPLVGPVADGVYVATGWQGHGFMRAPALGETVAGQVLGDDGVDAFDPRRFDGDEAFEIVEGMVVEER